MIPTVSSFARSRRGMPYRYDEMIVDIYKLEKIIKREHS
jgi:hypothetical protein